ncbi:thiamine pyrophosphate-binding protein [Mycolicibacterium thermoresistibile]|uniref:acetolactate synthase n=2 Tax=Mycolicibacterium thermoresistibile TaxID=1797 RepID=G7CG77_MYCT3|nr:thiamine pyrophosphate-binding protein [Mycolicibacterium thermoresistibile]EHI13506.1 thiamine pyrophosphate binding domain-containing protein [Mycolicibacterium thermoresistibile ATCC 19527]MCV7188729.1 thiamine pyrophosphate-binding protein [Mycolicibacterium thermoresistibile]GAT16742.1 thiamine pyrophosphate binding domain-containing protein [Mycolicibacterium thermoresistibile]SNW18802.1 thiamine pyrophosphate binding domain-containing protein [Mycolicibacterium thermoresistibile]
MTVNGGELLARALSDGGITEVFTLHGGHLDAFYVACGDHGIRLTDTRHESSAGHAADAYARLTGNVGVCVVTSGPGFTNAYTAIVNAYLDRTPTLFIVGAPPLRETETNPLQGGFDQVAAAEPVTKWAYRLTEARRIPEIVALAIRKATSGAPGPVLLEVPIDVMFGQTDAAAVRRPATGAVPSAPAPDRAAVQQALDVLAEAKNPVIISGGGVVFARAAEELVSFAETVGVPVFSPGKSDGAIPAGHRLAAGGLLALGALPMLGAPTPDVVLLLGARTGMFTGGRASMFPGARIIQVDLDAAEIGRMHDVAVPIVADCRATLEALTAAAAERSWPDWSEWVSVATGAQRFHEALYTDDTTASGRIHPYFAAKAVVESCPPGTIFVLDGAEAPAWAEFFARTEIPSGVLRLGYLGALGVGPGFAIGAARAHPDAPVVLITGDGAAGFHPQEFDTMARHGMPVVTVVFNNAVWGMSIHGQQAVYGEKCAVVTELADSAYEKVAEAFGGHGERVRTADAIPDAMRRALSAGVPACLNLEIDPAVVHPLTTMMLGDVKATDEIVIPYYENLPR